MTESESKFDEMERDRLQAVVSALETALAVSSPASRTGVERGLHGAKSRMEFLNKKIKDAQAERENHVREQAGLVATLAERETRLNSEEKRTYAGFLERDYFTKSDFGPLESFYGKSWDRLSDSGKNEMSHRVWEGIRKGEYTFKELPPKVREKETEGPTRTWLSANIHLLAPGKFPKRIVMTLFALTKVEGKKSVRKFSAVRVSSRTCFEAPSRRE